ncbi:MAG: hypothetical protein PHF50_04165, partial [Patescibacteria group bacterium]|nr:hypothetical protein [Patescibacteria group bacterium]
SLDSPLACPTGKAERHRPTRDMRNALRPEYWPPGASHIPRALDEIMPFNKKYLGGGKIHKRRSHMKRMKKRLRKKMIKKEQEWIRKFGSPCQQCVDACHYFCDACGVVSGY